MRNPDDPRFPVHLHLTRVEAEQLHGLIDRALVPVRRSESKAKAWGNTDVPPEVDQLRLVRQQIEEQT